MKITLSEQGTGFFLPKLEINGCNVTIDGRNILDQPIIQINDQKINYLKQSGGFLGRLLGPY